MRNTHHSALLVAESTHAHDINSTSDVLYYVHAHTTAVQPLLLLSSCCLQVAAGFLAATKI